MTNNDQLGPKKHNATSHGITSKPIETISECPKEMQIFAEEICQSLAPETMLEKAFALRVIDSLWRLKRISEVTESLFVRELESIKVREIPDPKRKLAVAFSSKGLQGSLKTLSRYEGCLMRSLHRSLDTFFSLVERRKR